jgi:hypothetical protein
VPSSTWLYSISSPSGCLLLSSYHTVAKVRMEEKNQFVKLLVSSPRFCWNGRSSGIENGKNQIILERSQQEESNEQQATGQQPRKSVVGLQASGFQEASGHTCSMRMSVIQLWYRHLGLSKDARYFSDFNLVAAKNLLARRIPLLC